MIRCKSSFNQLFVVFLVCLGVVIVSCGRKDDDDANANNDNADKSHSWEMPVPNNTGIDPLVGKYNIDSEDCFEVVEESSKKYVRFSSDCFRYDMIEIKNGAFYFEWGEINGIHCPSDGYAISGSFDSQTTASGIIKYAPGCSIREGNKFTAEAEP